VELCSDALVFTNINIARSHSTAALVFNNEFKERQALAKPFCIGP